MKDEVKKYLVCEGRVSVIVANTTELVEEYRKMQNLTPTTTAVMGRFLTIAGMMGHTSMKEDEGTITLQIKGGGPVGTLVAVVSKEKDCAKIKGYIQNPSVELPAREDGKIDVGGAVGNNGFLNVIKESKYQEQGYNGVIELVSGEIAEDFTEYFAKSEQTPNVLALGVLVDKDGVVASGGYKIELMPDATEEDIKQLENAIKQAPSISQLLEENKSLDEIVEIVTGDENSMVLAKKLEIKYECNCSKEKFKQGLASIGKAELEKIINEDEKADIKCQFCNKEYHFSKEELQDL
jgi:molecular chaperone Hsp33